MCVRKQSVHRQDVVEGPVRDLPQNNMQAWQDWFTSRSHEYDLFVNLSHSCEGMLAVFPAMTYFTWPAQFRRKQFGGNYLETVHDVVGVPYDFGPLFFSTRKRSTRRMKPNVNCNGAKSLDGVCLAPVSISSIRGPHDDRTPDQRTRGRCGHVRRAASCQRPRDAAHIQEHVKRRMDRTTDCSRRSLPRRASGPFAGR